MRGDDTLRAGRAGAARRIAGASAEPAMSSEPLLSSRISAERLEFTAAGSWTTAHSGALEHLVDEAVLAGRGRQRHELMSISLMMCRFRTRDVMFIVGLGSQVITHNNADAR